MLHMGILKLLRVGWYFHRIPMQLLAGESLHHQPADACTPPKFARKFPPLLAQSYGRGLWKNTIIDLIREFLQNKVTWKTLHEERSNKKVCDRTTSSQSSQLHEDDPLFRLERWWTIWRKITDTPTVSQRRFSTNRVFFRGKEKKKKRVYYVACQAQTAGKKTGSNGQFFLTWCWNTASQGCWETEERCKSMQTIMVLHWEG